MFTSYSFNIIGVFKTL